MAAWRWSSQLQPVPPIQPKKWPQGRINSHLRISVFYWSVVQRSLTVLIDSSMEQSSLAYLRTILPSFRILFTCNHDVKIGSPELVSEGDGCSLELEWATTHACPPHRVVSPFFNFRLPINSCTYSYVWKAAAAVSANCKYQDSLFYCFSHTMFCLGWV